MDPLTRQYRFLVCFVQLVQSCGQGQDSVHSPVKLWAIRQRPCVLSLCPWAEHWGLVRTCAVKVFAQGCVDGMDDAEVLHCYTDVDSADCWYL